MAAGIVHFEMHVGDIERAKKFYSEVFDWTFRDANEVTNIGMEYWLINTGRTNGVDGKPIGIDGAMLLRSGKLAEDGISPNAFINTMQVDDIDATLKLATEGGGVIQTEKMQIPHVGWYCGLKDPEGNFISVLQPE